MAKTGFFSALFARGVNFYRRGMWLPDASAGRVRRLMLGVLRRLVLTVERFFGLKMNFRASALTYITLLSVVPLLSVVFAIAKGFGLQQLIEGEIRRSFVAQPEVTETLIGFVDSYLSHARGGVFLGFGLLLLLWSLTSLTSSIEGTFNQIWSVERERSLLRKLTDYAAVFFLLPVMVLVAAGLSIFVNSFVGHLPDVFLLRPTLMTALRVAPYIIMCLLFTALFIFMPNTKVSLRSALTGGIPCGLAFQALQYFYIHSQVWLSGYNAIYGSFAALPLFMLWCQLSWYICLFGATLSFVDHNIDGLCHAQTNARPGRSERDFLSLSLMAEVMARFAKGLPPLTAEELAKAKGLLVGLTDDLLADLCHRGLLATARVGKRNVFLPTENLERIPVGTLLETLNSEEERTTPDTDLLRQRYDRERKQMFDKAFADMTLADFCRETPNATDKNPLR